MRKIKQCSPGGQEGPSRANLSVSIINDIAIATSSRAGGRNTGEAEGKKEGSKWTKWTKRSSEFSLVTIRKEQRTRSYESACYEMIRGFPARASCKTLEWTVMQEKPRLARPLGSGSTGLNCNRAAPASSPSKTSRFRARNGPRDPRRARWAPRRNI